MLRGLTTVNLIAEDVPATVAWYTEVLEIEPYFVRPVEGPPAYVEFRIGDYQHELGIIDARYASHRPTGQPAGAVVSWHVDDVAAAVDRLTAMGATTHDPLTVREAGFVTASVVDPFGNILGLMYSPHYLAVLAGNESE